MNVSTTSILFIQSFAKHFFASCDLVHNWLRKLVGYAINSRPRNSGRSTDNVRSEYGVRLTLMINIKEVAVYGNIYSVNYETLLVARF